MNAIIIHGKPSRATYYATDKPSPSNDGWLPWLQKQLLAKDIPTETPEMFRSFQPDYQLWSATFERQTIDSETLLVGHSVGGGFLVQYLSEHPDIVVKHVFLVAPTFGDALVAEPQHKYHPDERPINGFFDFKPDPKLLTRIRTADLIFSDNDSVRVDTTVRLLREIYPNMPAHEFSGYGHFRGRRDMTDDTFPELLEIISKRLQED